MKQKPKTKPNKGGRPSDFSQEIADAICDRISEGGMLTAICNEEGMPPRKTVYTWMSARPEFKDAYARAREEWAEFYEEKVLAIAFDDKADFFVENGKTVADHARVARARLQVDTLKWFMMKWAPRRYGDRLPELVEEKAGSVAELMKAIDGRTRGLSVSWEPPQKIERIILEGVPAEGTGYVDELKKRIEELEIELGHRPAPPRLLTYDPGPIPTSVTEKFTKDVAGLIRDCVPLADSRPYDDVLREVLTICGDALRAHYAAQSVHGVCTNEETQENAA